MPSSPIRRVVDLEEAEALVARAKAAGKRVVLANGHFDLLHVGHVRYLEGARACGDYLVVAVNDDHATARQKGRGRPIVPAAERAEMVAALSVVDVVLIFGQECVSSLLERLRPDVHCKGTDYLEDTVPERDVMRRLGGDTRIVGDPKRHATRDVIATVLERFGPTAKEEKGPR
ncbi:MAG TPA: adenylyltransferase/cytidyltransferase family protein [Vicinamibacteria bacterium]|nr:adenylyltransferase/cytidyltransferase family protein [Vicinamibacteria bacterium]